MLFLKQTGILWLHHHSANTKDSHCVRSLQETKENAKSRIMSGKEKYSKQVAGGVRVIFRSTKKSRQQLLCQES